MNKTILLNALDEATLNQLDRLTPEALELKGKVSEAICSFVEVELLPLVYSDIADELSRIYHNANGPKDLEKQLGDYIIELEKHKP